jgi:hypothetical protein
MPIQKITSGIIQDGAVAAADIVSVSNTAISGLITASQIAAVNGSVITANTIANSAIQTGAVENYMSAAGLGFGMRNRIINGAMVIDQRNAGASVTSGFPVDRFSTNFSVASKFTLQRSTTAPAGFSNSLLITSSSAYSIGSGDYFLLNQTIEGYNIADLNWGTANAVPATLSFWVRASLTGTYSVNFQSGSATTVNYLASYTINSANTWEFKTITLSAPTSGGFPIDNSSGVAIRFTLGTGSSQTGATTTWATSGVSLGATGQVNLSGTNGATFYITGVQLEKGSTATSFDYRDFARELIMCQRYFETNFPSGVAVGSISLPGFVSTSTSTNASNESQGVQFSVKKRAIPTIVIYHITSGTAGSVYRVSDAASVVVTPTHIGQSGIGFLALASGSANGYYWNYTASSEI